VIHHPGEKPLEGDMEGKGAFRVGLLLTERCTSTCRHCWFSSGPEREASMTLEEARGYIRQASKVPTMEWVSFTGGEPFLLPDLLEELISYASGMGLRTEAVTNCHWAGTPESAEGALEPLVEAGLDVINISSDDFHQAHTPFERVGNCYRAARGLGLRVVIMCTKGTNTLLDVKKISGLLGDEGIHLIGKDPPARVSALAMEGGFVPVGRASSIPKDEWLLGDGRLEGPCRAVLRDVGVSTDGRLLCCCSAACLTGPGVVGDLGRVGLGELLEGAWGDPVYRVLSEDGPLGLSGLLGIEVGGGYVNRCHLCHELLNDPGIGSLRG